jgi:hypothetical protein
MGSNLGMALAVLAGLVTNPPSVLFPASPLAPLSPPRRQEKTPCAQTDPFSRGAWRTHQPGTVFGLLLLGVGRTSRGEPEQGEGRCRGADASSDFQQHLRMPGGNFQQNPGRPRRRAAPLLPILQGIGADAENRGEPRL